MSVLIVLQRLNGLNEQKISIFPIIVRSERNTFYEETLNITCFSRANNQTFLEELYQRVFC